MQTDFCTQIIQFLLADNPNGLQQRSDCMMQWSRIPRTDLSKKKLVVVDRKKKLQTLHRLPSKSVDKFVCLSRLFPKEVERNEKEKLKTCKM